jgi:hypothetical protein
MHAPIESHWAAIKCILRYLKGTSSYDLHLTRGSSLSLHWLLFIDKKRVKLRKEMLVQSKLEHCSVIGSYLKL